MESQCSRGRRQNIQPPLDIDKTEAKLADRGCSSVHCRGGLSMKCPSAASPEITRPSGASTTGSVRHDKEYMYNIA